MKLSRSLLVSALFVLVAVAAAAWLYPALPAQVPTHWGPRGQVDGYHSRLWAAAFPAVAIALLALVAAVLPAVSPKRFRIAPFAPVWHLAMLAVQGMLLAIGLSMLLSAAGYAVPVPTVAMLCVGALFVVLGNYMGKLRRNFFIGIRTPWTLASEDVWERTHRLGGWLFVLAGLAAIAATLLDAPRWFALAALLTAALAPCAYSLWLYWRLELRR